MEEGNYISLYTKSRPGDSTRRALTVRSRTGEGCEYRHGRTLRLKVQPDVAHLISAHGDVHVGPLAR